MKNNQEPAMGSGAIVKIVFLVLLLIAANALLGMICNKVRLQYGLLFAPTIGLFYLALWLLGAMALTAAFAGILTGLVRSFWIRAAAFALSALALVYFFQAGILISAAIWAAYMLFAVLSSHMIKRELNNRLNFSVMIIKRKLRLFVQLLILLVCFSFSLGYRDDAIAQGFILPPSLKQAFTEAVSPVLQAQAESQSGMPAEATASQQGQVNQAAERLFQEAEASLQPYAEYVWLFLALALYIILNVIQLVLSWIPWLLMHIVFALMRLFRMAEIVTEKRDKRSLVLR